jgi:carbamoyltransferase
MRVLGYNGAIPGYPGRWGAGHDSAAALLVNGQLVAACEEERFNRLKHTRAFPRLAIEFCLRQAGLRSLQDVDLITYYWSYPLMFRQDMLESHRADLSLTQRAGLHAFLAGMRTYNRAAVYTDDRIRQELSRVMGVPIEREKFRSVPHHLCHAAAAFYGSPFEDALCLSLDAAGECSSSLVVCARGTKLQTLDEVFIPNGLGYLYLFITAFLGFQVMSDEYKVMGLAPYGERKRYRHYFQSIVKLLPEGRYQVNPSLMMRLMVAMHTPGLSPFPHTMVNALGPPRARDAEIQSRHVDIAAGVQDILEEAVLHTLGYWRQQTRHRHLCVGGGVALNGTLNGRIAQSGLFDGVWVHPASHDAGTSVGAARVGYHGILGQPRQESGREPCFLGPQYSQQEMDQALRDHGLEAERVPQAQFPRQVASAIGKGKVVGFFQSRAEWGPRALGHRSILADPRRAEMKDIVNHAVKFREGFRPFAPAVLHERMHDWFELGILPESPFMTFVVPVRSDRRSRIPAVTHVDGSARVQTVKREDDPVFHSVISAFEEETGVPVLLNTSFNVKGEPMVQSPHDAVKCFIGTALDVLVLGDAVVTKAPHGVRTTAPSAVPPAARPLLCSS